MDETKLFIKGRVFPVLFMLIITLVFIGITTSIYTITKDRIELNKTINIKKAVLDAAGIKLPKNPREVEKLYEDLVVPVKGKNGKIAYYKIMSKDKSGINSYVFITSGAGLWGKITAAVGIDPSLKNFTGIEIIDQVETPGLGGRITEEWFKKQFRGKTAPLSTVPEGETASKNQFQAITGATYSTNAIRDMLNKLFTEIPDKIKS